ncbi:MAG: hypothetical protein HDQ88_04610 [Clostridia bacterium]|nr:hypothetical protein [Clostridia bacterium]
MKYSREITLALKLNPTMFQVVNRKAIGSFNTMFGPSNKAISILSSRNAEMASIMPEILGISPDSRDTNFQEAVLKYLRTIIKEVPAEGIKLETGWDLDIDNPFKKDEILKWAKEHGIDTTQAHAKLEKEIFEAMLFGDKRVHEELLFQYMKPINPADYVIWRLALNTSTVANKPEDVDKSTNIRFYLHSKEDAKRIKEAKTKTTVDTVQKLATLYAEANNDRIIDILICANPNDVLSIIKKEPTDLQVAITELSQSNPDKFLDLYGKAEIKAYAQVHKLLAAQVITKDGDKFFDTNHPDKVLGSSIEGVIAFLADEANKEYKSQLFTAYKAAILN